MVEKKLAVAVLEATVLDKRYFPYRRRVDVPPGKELLVLSEKDAASVFMSFDKSGSLPLPAPTGLSGLGMSVGSYCFLFFLSG